MKPQAKLSAEELARQVKAFRPAAIGSFVAEAVVVTDQRRARERKRLPRAA